MISLAPTGINQGDFSRLLGGAHNSPAADFIVMEVRMAVLNLNSAAPDLATFSKLFSAVAAGDLPLAERGSDVEADIMVTLEEALHGSTRTVSLRRAGSNKVENYQVKIPRGVHEAQRIRLAGQGEAGERGGKSGDLFLRVRLARHPDFSIEGSDLIHEVKIAPWQAVLGTELKVPTLEGTVRLKVPSGTQGGQRFRLRGRGLPSSSGTRGDLYVEVQINVPKKITDREREIWRELAKLYGA